MNLKQNINVAINLTKQWYSWTKLDQDMANIHVYMWGLKYTD